MLYEGYGLANLTALRAFFQESLEDSGYDADYSQTDYDGYKIQNILTTTGDDAYFTPILYYTGATTVGLTLASETTPTTADNLIGSTDLPKFTDLTFPLDAFIVATDQRVVLGLRYGGNFRVLAAACLDYRSLEQANTEDDATHQAHLRNNNQAALKLGDPVTGRLLYTGTPGAYTFNGALKVDSMTFAPSGPPLMGKVGVSTVLAGLTSQEAFFGVMSGILLSHSSAFHNLDYATDELGRQFRVFRDSASGKVLLARENN